MEARISIITLGVRDLQKARDFYEHGLGWKASKISSDAIVFFQLGGIALSLFPLEKLAEDTLREADGNGFRGVTLAHNVAVKEDVAHLLRQAERAGGTIVKPAQDVFWGGHSGYFADPDGHLWEIAWNPHLPLNNRGEIQLP